LIYCFQFSACIPCVPLRHDIKEWGEFAAFAVRAVYIVADGDKADTFLPEENLGVKTDLQIIASKAAHVFHDDRAHVSAFDRRDHFLEAFALKGGSAHAVV